MPESRKFQCLYPCKRAFTSETRLTQHYQNVPLCKVRWEAQINTRIQADFQEYSLQRRIASRPSNIGSVGPDINEPIIEENPATLAEIVPVIDDNPFDNSEPILQEEPPVEGEPIVQNEPLVEGEPAMDNEPTFVDQLYMDDDRDPVNHISDQTQGDKEHPISSDTSEDDDEPSTSSESEGDLMENNPEEGDENNPYDDQSDSESEGEGSDEDLEERWDLEALEAALENARIHPGIDEDTVPSRIDSFPRAGEVKTEYAGRPYFAETFAAHTQNGTRSPYTPFSGPEDFELAKWLNDLPVSKTDSFLHLEWTRRAARGGNDPSFQSGKTLRERIGKLPASRMAWKSIRVIPRSGETTSPVYLCYRDPIDAIRSLLDRYSLRKHLSFTPQRHWKNVELKTRLYNEIFTGDWAWETQFKLPRGATLLPILLGSDKAHLTAHSGNKSAWPVYLSLGNIHSSIRNKPSHKCWILIAYLPIPVFTEKDSTLHTPLQQRLFHQCLKIILKTVKTAGDNGIPLGDYRGDYRLCFPRVAAYLADYPEQVLINIAAHNHSSVTIATNKQLGDSEPHPRRTKQWIMSQVQALCRSVDPDNVAKYHAAAKKVGLSAVDQPFWADLPDYEPDLVLAPDILHGLFKFWRDHVLKWVRHLVGENELDHRLRILQPLKGMRHFKNGVSHLAQWTGRDDRELQRVLMAVIPGIPSIDGRTMRCLRAIHDFIYFAQYRSHSTTTLSYLTQSLQVFHSLKRVFIENGARRANKKKSANKIIPHFRIPKIAGLHMYSYHIPRMGSSVQFSTEITETCHQSMAKAAYRATNSKEFFAQMCAYLNRRAAISLTEELCEWYFSRALARQFSVPLVMLKDYSAYLDTRVEAEKLAKKRALIQVTREQKDHVWLNKKPNRRGVYLETLTHEYSLPDLQDVIARLLLRCPEGTEVVSEAALKYDAWYQCRIQRPSAQDEDVLSDSRTIQARPPAATRTQYGRCNCALIKKNEDDIDLPGIHGYRIGQVRLIFQMRVPKSHPYYHIPFAYVYWFFKPSKQAKKNINMYSTQYKRRADGSRRSGIVPLKCIRKLLQLTPVHGGTVSDTLSVDNSMDVSPGYWVNPFMDRETFQTIW